MSLRVLRWQVSALGAVALLGLPTVAAAAALAGDLNGDGNVTVADESFLFPAYGSSAADSSSFFEPAADLNGDGGVDLKDAALFGASIGAGGGDIDVTPPGLFVSLNDVPDDENDLLVVPPDGFQITLTFDGGLESAIDTGSLSIASSEDMAGLLAGAELASQFTLTPTRGVWQLPVGADLSRTSYHITVAVRDAAGNESTDTYGFAVRDFNNGPPLAEQQVFFLDFSQDRSLGPDVDFLEDLREYGLSSTATNPFFENNVSSTIQWIIRERVNERFGLATNGSPGPDSVDIRFSNTQPEGTYSRLCIGGESQSGPSFLGNTILDVENASQSQDDCDLGSAYGVFPQAIDVLWGSNAELQAAFYPLDPDHGGIPVGQDPIDSYIFGLEMTSEDLEAVIAFGERPGAVANAVDAFTQVVATAIAHELGHMLGLTAPGPAPEGLFGGAPGTSNQDHNVNTGGGTPTQNYIMNRGSSFTFEEMSGRGGESLAYFRAINWAYLHNRIALNDDVTGLIQPPILNSISPNSAIYPGPFSPVVLTFNGDHFVDQPSPPSILLLIEGDPTPNPVTSVHMLDPQTITGQIHPLFVPPGLYDVEFTNGDGQQLYLIDYLDVQLP